MITDGGAGRLMHRGAGLGGAGDGGFMLSTVFREDDPNSRDAVQGFRCAR